MASAGAARSLKHSWNGAVSAGTVPNLEASVLKRQISRMLSKRGGSASASTGKESDETTHMRACCVALSTLMSGPPDDKLAGSVGKWSRSASVMRGATKSG